MKGYEQQAGVMKALAHPVRLRILDILCQEEQCVCHLTTVLGVRQPYVSQQLAILREVGLVTDRREGLIVYYSLHNQQVARVMSAVREMVTDHLGGPEGWSPVPKRPVPGCPCPKCQAERK